MDIIRLIKILLEPIKYYKSLNYEPFTKNLKNLSICSKSKSLFIRKEMLSGINLEDGQIKYDEVKYGRQQTLKKEFNASLR